MCKGSAEFIHKTCLEEYIRHFPDGVCRVCLKYMTPEQDTYELISQTLLYLWLTFLLSISEIPAQMKLVYFIMTIALIIFVHVRKFFTYPVILFTFSISFFIIFVNPLDVVKLVPILGTAMMIATMAHYIPPEYLCMIVAIVLTSVYATLGMLFVATHTDIYMTGYFIGFVSLFWYTCVRLRQPFN